ncbi:unnamed protein product [Linum tenue]|uniref:CCHC-type domain-containing protein n=1 Tax=Linum tenue TaxID=586396 RepID=A0AAV0ISH3_9ROSI|nr:unnamed protein product [Linum tenue]
MVVWVQFPGLPVHFYHKELLFTMGNLLGRSIKLDYHTQHQQREKFARMAVEVDLSKPLVPRIRLDGRWQKVEYENLPVVCFECGKVGHTNVSCHSTGRGVNSGAEIDSMTSAVVVAGEALPEANAGFGPWMIVSRKSWRNQKDTLTNGKTDQGVAIPNGLEKGEERKEVESLGKVLSQKSGLSERKQRQQAGDKEAAKAEGKGRGNAKGKGKAVEPVGLAEKGVLGPKPKTGEASSSGASHAPTKAINPTAISLSPQSTAVASDGPDGKGMVLGSPTGPASQTFEGKNGTQIRIVEAQPYEPAAPRLVDPETPSAVSRTKPKKEGRGGGGKKTATPKKGTSMRHNPLKPLQIWSPVKEKKGRNKEKRVSLTLKQIKEWAETAKPKTAAGIELMSKEEAGKMAAEPGALSNNLAAPGH